jgi:hypothetical protein
MGDLTSHRAAEIEVIPVFPQYDNLALLVSVFLQYDNLGVLVSVFLQYDNLAVMFLRLLLQMNRAKYSKFCWRHCLYVCSLTVYLTTLSIVQITIHKLQTRRKKRSWPESRC